MKTNIIGSYLQILLLFGVERWTFEDLPSAPEFTGALTRFSYQGTRLDL